MYLLDLLSYVLMSDDCVFCLGCFTNPNQVRKTMALTMTLKDAL